MKVENLKTYVKGTLKAFFSLQLDSGMVIRGMTYHVKNGNRWVSFPGKSYQDENGETKYQNILHIPDEARWKKFQSLALAALDVVLNETQETSDIPF